ncbi:hypothetical protein [Persicitalea jodogahamensis]|uniref:hypothetical protein n=1 Tax=Persicitalea jodogahamensis TaxID=402147 RepID=UPI00167450DA|nr:hypothetical protein [Persicitalea jodogahamensis]
MNKKEEQSLFDCLSQTEWVIEGLIIRHDGSREVQHAVTRHLCTTPKLQKLFQP